MNVGCLLQVGLLGLAGLAEGAEPSPQPGNGDLVARLADYLGKHRVRAEQAALTFDRFAEAWAVIEGRPDPRTTFETFIFGIQRHAGRLLTAEQAKHWEDLLARHTPIMSRWHDERNLVRCLFERSRWDYAIADEACATASRREMQRWLDLRMAWMFEEQIVHHRFCRDAWKILTEEQRQEILAGKWDGQVKKSTGHSYAMWAERIVIRAMGKAQDTAAFKQAVATQQAAYAEPHARYTAAATRHRRVTFALDVNHEPMVLASWRDVDRTFREIVLAEAEAIRVLCRAGYRLSATEFAQKAGQAKAAIWQEGLERFGAARELIGTVQE